MLPAHEPWRPDSDPAEQDTLLASGTVDVAPGLGDRVTSGDVLWIVARPAAGGPPVAIKRLEPVLPTPFELRSGDNPMPGLRPPSSGPILIKARIDRDGDALTTTDGDLEGIVSDIEPGTRGVELIIDYEIGYQ